MQLPEELVESFASLDRARLGRTDQRSRETQLVARQDLLDYIEALWQDVERAGERPGVGEKYQALAVVLDLARSLTAVAFDAVYDQNSSEADPGT
ncbi:hypothetical protein ACQP04_02270 [Pseudonocardia halophobica]|uniref:hypothetical protein n=1 Tax=Pseudonocardia halophobica TaxID=29401 RepID=UPI003D8F2087